MKLNMKYMSLLFAGAAVLASCDKNEPNRFNDKDAFVAFDEVAVSYDEDYSKDGATFKIPVTLASVKGLEETVKFEIVAPEEKAAVAGVNYELLTTTGVLSFDAEHRTQHIEFKTIADGAYVGDLKFIVKLIPSETLTLGAESECTVTISDIDHPLTFMLGAYTASGDKFADFVNNEIISVPVEWTMTFLKDDEDDSMVWIDNIFANDGWKGDDTMYYGIVSDDYTTLTIPFGQESEYLYGGETPITLYGLDSELMDYDTGNLVVAISVDGGKVSLDFGDEYGIWAYIENTGSIGTILPGISAVKN